MSLNNLGLSKYSFLLIIIVLFLRENFSYDHGWLIGCLLF